MDPNARWSSLPPYDEGQAGQVGPVGQVGKPSSLTYPTYQTYQTYQTDVLSLSSLRVLRVDDFRILDVRTGCAVRTVLARAALRAAFRRRRALVETLGQRVRRLLQL